MHAKSILLARSAFTISACLDLAPQQFHCKKRRDCRERCIGLPDGWTVCDVDRGWLLRQLLQVQVPFAVNERWAGLGRLEHLRWHGRLHLQQARTLILAGMLLQQNGQCDNVVTG